jgi:hypothetical protein
VKIWPKLQGGLIRPSTSLNASPSEAYTSRNDSKPKSSQDDAYGCGVLTSCGAGDWAEEAVLAGDVGGVGKIGAKAAKLFAESAASRLSKTWTVYLARDSAGKIIYVGITSNFERRALEHATSTSTA